MADAFAVTNRNRLRRRHERGQYDRASVYAILDAAMLCHIAYVIDEQPYCTPTSFWREGDDLYWHGSSASRMVRAQADGIPVCLTVTHLDGLVVTRSGFHHSVNYRSVMAFGRAQPVTDPADKLRAMDAFIDRFYPRRTAVLRPPIAQEIKAITILKMPIEQASAKVRAVGVVDEAADYALPVWSAVIPTQMVIGPAAECERQSPNADRRAGGVAGYTPGRRLDEVMLESYRARYPGDA
jgi:nitroimidazol reductase NimA-like FMN-containing flavoprotein (pyridoxamine 5'-phosphate oxidase superfamily)